ncbi:response regulator [Pseudoalteromonas sp. JBTF-M23]|uniref:histidine kinase n=1 Tax=Pseudoalteromonas caenipelagi TaxID=2726988 RepID=A0A849VA89_9GAMM|nr:response regulator [Pseudoalteromonas caenipelagi]NOU50539.1 response regulator [Pseudoalteromonas caenipelagi]
MIRLKSLFVMLFAFMFFTCVSLVFVSSYIGEIQAEEQRARQQLIMFNQLADDFKQMSEHRSSFARAYISTGEERWLTLFNYAIAVYEGNAKIIDKHALNYWDSLALTTSKIPAVDNSYRSKPFIERFEAIKLRHDEFAQVDQALEKVGQLIEIERSAIAEKQQKSNLSHKLLDDSYLSVKNDVMYSLENVAQLIFQRLEAQASKYTGKLNTATQTQNFIIGVLLLAITLSFYFLWRYYIWPISRIQKALVAQVESNNFDFQLANNYYGELAEFAQAMNQLLGDIAEQLKYSSIQKDLNQALRGKTSAQELGDEVIEFICERLSIPLVGLYVWHEDELFRVSGIGYEGQDKETYQDEDSVYFHVIKRNKKYSIDVSEQYAILHQGKRLLLKELHYFPLSMDDNCIGLLELGSFYNISEKEFYWLNFIIRDLSIGLHLARNQERQRKTERMVVEQLELNRKIIDAIPNPMYYRNTEGVYLGVNSQFHDFIGTFEADVIGATPDNIFSFDIASRFNESQRQLLAKPGSHNYEMRLKDVHEQIREVVVYEATFSDADNKVAGIVGLLLDVTKSKEMELQLREAKAKADSTSKAKGEFLANMSHEIRTPMNAIIGMSHLVLNTKLSKQQNNYIKKIDVAANNLLGIINDVLDFSKIESGKMAIVEEAFDLEEVTSNVTVVNSVKAEDKGIELLLDIPPTIPTNLIGDPLRLGQVLINLCGNAIKFTEQGEVIITARVIERTKGSATLKFTVKDSGIGLTQEQQDKLFKAFSQADSSITRKYGGTGLGLSISKHLVELMGGQIGVTSEPGVGSEFYFTIKVGLQEQANKQWFCPESIIRNTSVLVVDDNEAAREVMSNLVQGLGFKTYAVSCAQEALKELTKRPYQIVFTDWSMPNIDGCELALRINELDLNPKPKVILVTAHSKELDIDQEVSDKLDGIISKPMNASIVFDCVLDCFDIRTQDVSNVELLGKEIVSFTDKTALLVEDNETNQEVATEMLRSLGIQVTIANNGKEAIEILEQQKQFSLVFMDMQMPVMDGLTATTKIRAQSKFADLPIVAMTANAMREDIECCLNAGMNAHIAKPINFKALVSTIKKVTKKSQWLEVNTKEKPENTKAQPVPQDAVFVLEGIDIQDGINRIGGNERAYWSILGKFIHKQIEELINVEQAMIIGDLEHASRIVHSLKGSAANLSAHYLVEQGAKFEEQIKDTAELDVGMLHKVIDYLRKIDKQLSIKESKTALKSQDEVQPQASNLKKLFDELYELVDGNDVQSLDLVDTLFAHDSLAKDKLDELRKKINDFEFEQAKEIIQQIRVD